MKIKITAIFEVDEYEDIDIKKIMNQWIKIKSGEYENRLMGFIVSTEIIDEQSYRNTRKNIN